MASASWELDWNHRPREEAALFNPAFCGEILCRSVSALHQTAARPLALPLAYLILPLTLGARERTALPGRADTSFQAWAPQHQVLLADLPERVVRLRPITREALLFMVAHRALALAADGVTTGETPLKLTRKIATSTDEVAEIRSAAGLLGRWFGQQGGQMQLLQTMGIRP